MSSVQQTNKPSANPRRAKRTNARTLEVHTQCIRTRTQTIDRLARKAQGGTRGRINEKLMQALKILDDIVETDGRYLKAINSTREIAVERGEDWVGAARLDVKG